MMVPRQQTRSPAQTTAVAQRLAADLRPGDCIALYGELGAGKTHFVRALVEALGGQGRDVSSPTFVLLHVYSTPKMTVYHLDAYRVGGAEDLAAIGFSELLEQGGLVIVEWADRVESILPANRLNVRLDILGPRRRAISIG